MSKNVISLCKRERKRVFKGGDKENIYIYKSDVIYIILKAAKVYLSIEREIHREFLRSFFNKRDTCIVNGDVRIYSC